MKVRHLLAILTVLALTVLSAGPAFAAQGQITEVNPSGVGFGARGFDQRGAQLEFISGDDVTFLSISLPTGGRIIREIGKKNN